MEEYINEFINIKTIIKNEMYNAFKDLISCSICSNVLINPVMCMKCQTTFCKRCADDWSQKNEKCIKGCSEPNYEICKTKKDILSKLKFKCQKCELEFQYDDAEEHSKLCGVKEPTPAPTPSLISSNIYSKPVLTKNNNQKATMEKLTNGQLNELIKKGKDVSYITSKKNIFFILFN